MEKALRLVVQGLAEAYELEISRDALVSELKKRIRERLKDQFRQELPSYYKEYIDILYRHCHH